MVGIGHFSGGQYSLGAIKNRSARPANSPRFGTDQRQLMDQAVMDYVANVATRVSQAQPPEAIEFKIVSTEPGRLIGVLSVPNGPSYGWVSVQVGEEHHLLLDEFASGTPVPQTPRAFQNTTKARSLSWVSNGGRRRETVELDPPLAGSINDISLNPDVLGFVREILSKMEALIEQKCPDISGTPSVRQTIAVSGPPGSDTGGRAN